MPMSGREEAILRARQALAPLAGKVGVTTFNWQMLESIRRTEWLYRAKGRIPSARIDKRASVAVGDADVRLCQRLITAHSKATGDDPVTRATDGIWPWIFDTRQQVLATTIERSDAGALARLMASMFQGDFVLGMASGSLIDHAQSKLGRRVWCLKALDALASLAEALGVVAVENPEQGRTGLAFEGGSGELLVALERELGFRLDFPNVGAPCGLAIDGRLITLDTPDQIYAAVRLDQAICLHLNEGSHGASLPRIVEIGGGYGGMCYWFLQLRDAVARYTIVDLPIVNLIQGYFLARALGDEFVSFYGEPAARVEIVPNFGLAEVESPFDVMVNKDSMPEIPDRAVMEYLEWGASNCEGLFYSYNQESRAEFLGQPQGVVHEAVAKVGGFKRLRRDESWVRRGYVEEIYVPERHPALTPKSRSRPTAS